MIQYVLFDMDGTLLDTEELYERSWHESGKKWALPHFEDISYADQIAGRPVANSIRVLKEKYENAVDADAFMDERMALYCKYAETDLRLKPGCREILNFAREHHIACALATSTVNALAYANLDRVKLTAFFDAIVTGSMVQRGKPEPDIFIEAAKRIGADPRLCIVCEDSYSGIEAAYRAGMRPVFIPDRQKPNDKTEMWSYATVNSLFDVIDLIRKENQIQ